MALEYGSTGSMYVRHIPCFWWHEFFLTSWRILTLPEAWDRKWISQVCKILKLEDITRFLTCWYAEILSRCTKPLRGSFDFLLHFLEELCNIPCGYMMGKRKWILYPYSTSHANISASYILVLSIIPQSELTPHFLPSWSYMLAPNLLLLLRGTMDKTLIRYHQNSCSSRACERYCRPARGWFFMKIVSVMLSWV